MEEKAWRLDLHLHSVFMQGEGEKEGKEMGSRGREKNLKSKMNRRI